PARVVFKGAAAQSFHHGLSQDLAQHLAGVLDLPVVVLIVLGAAKEEPLWGWQYGLRDLRVAEPLAVRDNVTPLAARLKYGTCFDLARLELGDLARLIALGFELVQLVPGHVVSAAIILTALHVLDEPGVDRVGLAPVGNLLDHLPDTFRLDIRARLAALG